MDQPGEARKPWAVLAYTVADDKGGGRNLDAAAKDELMALCDASDFAEVSIAAQVDFNNIHGVFRAALVEPPPTRDFEDTDPENHPLWREIASKLSQSTMKLQMERADLNAARASVVQEFLNYGHAECPADRHVMFFYGHAHGPMGLYYDKDAGRRAENTSLRLNDLADALSSTERRASILVFRDCFMNTLESAYQFRGVAEFMIASQSLVPVNGIWPWGSLMGSLMPSATTADQALAFAKSLGKFLDTPENRAPFHDAPISLIDLRAADLIVAPLKALADALEDSRRDPKRAKACASALENGRVGYLDTRTTPGDPALIDVPTVCEHLQKTGIDAVANPARDLADVIKNKLVRWHHAQKDAYRGTSLYYQPSTKEDKHRSCIYDEGCLKDDYENYRKLALSVATGWDRIALNPLS